MAEPRHLSKAPITEAVIDLRCRARRKIDSEKLSRLDEAIGYGGGREEMRGMAFTFSAMPGVPFTPKTDDKGLMGGRFLSKDKKFIVQMRVDGVTFSRLPPYSEWDQIFPEATRLLEIFWREMEVEQVIRIGVRNINRLLFPRAEFSAAPEEFLTPAPSQPAGTAGIINQWMTRFLVNDPEGSWTAIVTQLSDMKVESPDLYAMILDTEVFSAKDLPTDLGEILPRFAPLRELKNRIFFSALTEKAVSLFE